MAHSHGKVDEDAAALRELLFSSSAGDFHKYARRIRKAKTAEYPRRSADDWSKASLAASDIIRRLRDSALDTVPRFQSDAMTQTEFAERFERASQPCVIGGLCVGWDAQSKWSLMGLLKDYGGEKFKVGEDDDGYAVYVKLKYFLRYVLENTDDSPLYIFDSSFADRAVRDNLPFARRIVSQPSTHPPAIASPSQHSHLGSSSPHRSPMVGHKEPQQGLRVATLLYR